MPMPVGSGGLASAVTDTDRIRRSSKGDQDERHLLGLSLNCDSLAANS